MISPLIQSKKRNLEIDFWVYAGNGGTNRPFVYNDYLYASKNNVFTMNEDMFTQITANMFDPNNINVPQTFTALDG